MREPAAGRTILAMLSGRRITLRVELARATPAPSTPRIKGFGRNGQDPMAVGMMLAVEMGCPVGEVQLGTLRWQFANRVEMLEAIDAACEEAARR